MSQLLTCTSSTRPSDVRTGDLLFETDTNRLIFWDGVVWRIYNSNRSLPGTGGEDELHYAGGIWSSSTANYFVDAVPLLHFDSKYVDGATANDESALDGKFLNGNTTTASTETVWKSRQGNYAMYNHSSNPNNQVVYNSSRGGFHARDFAPNGAVSDSQG